MAAEKLTVEERERDSLERDSVSGEGGCEVLGALAGQKQIGNTGVRAATQLAAVLGAEKREPREEVGEGRGR